MLNNVALGAFAHQPNGPVIEVEELDPIKQIFPQDGIIVTIFQRLYDGDKLSFAEASPYTRKTLAKYIPSIPASLSAQDLKEYNDATKEVQKRKETQRCYERHCPKIPQVCVDKRCIEVSTTVGNLIAAGSFFSSIGTAIAACCKAKGSCICCIGTKITCGITSGSLCGGAVLIFCCVLGLNAPSWIEEELEIEADLVNIHECVKQRKLDKINAGTRFPELLKMDDSAPQKRDLRHLDSDPSERSKLMPGHMRMSDE